ncbi:MAG: glycosyltransferase family 39 protein [Thermomicrobiales bacterium]
MTIVNLGVIALTIAVIAALLVDRLLGVQNISRVESTKRPASAMGAPVQSFTGRARSLPKSLVRFSDYPIPILILGLIGLVIGQIGLIGGDPSLRSYLLWFAGLAAIVMLDRQVNATRRPDRNAENPVRIAADFSRWRALMVVPLLLSAIFIISEAPDRAIGDSSLDLVMLWMLSIVALIAASGALPDAVPTGQFRNWVRANRVDIGALAMVIVVAAVPRFYSLSSYAWSMSGDEGTFGVTARSTLEGAMRNPFSSGPWGYPSLLFIVQGWFVDLFGGTVGSARMLSALFGIGSVVAVWFLVRDHFGRFPAILAALLCSALNFHVYWSRDAQDAAAPMFFLPLAILFLDRGLVSESRIDAVTAGLTIAMAQFFHPANRLLVPIALAYLVYALMLRTVEAREVSRRSWGATLANGGWMLAAIVIGHLPLLAYFETHRTAFWSRTNEVSVFASGWLDREIDITGDSSLEIMSRQIWHAVMLPFSTVPHGHYRPGSPLVGWPLVVFVAVGLALATVWFFHRRYFSIALGFWIVTIGLGFTEGPPMTNRYTPAAPFLAMLGAVGLWSLTSLVSRLLRFFPRRALLPVASGIVLLIAAWHIHFYFQDPNQVNLYSDANSQIANGVAREAEQIGEGATVYLAGAPRLFYYGFMNIPFIAPDATGIDVDPMWSANQTPPELTGPTLFAFIPERLGELEIVRAWFPDGRRQEHFLPDGSSLYTSYLVSGET